MNINIQNELIRYEKNPAEYLRDLSSVGDIAVDYLMGLLKLKQFDIELLKNIEEYCSVRPVLIINSNYSTDDKLYLLNAIYLTGDLGITDITEYYLNDYKPVHTDDKLECLNLHIGLLSSFLCKLMKPEHAEDFKQTWFMDNILDIDLVFKYIVSNLDILEKNKLAPLLLIYYVFDKTGISELFAKNDGDLVSMQELFKNNVDQIAHHIYGEYTSNILETADILNLKNEVAYWISAIDTKLDNDATNEMTNLTF